MTQAAALAKERQTANVEIIRRLYQDATSRKSSAVALSLMGFKQFLSLVGEALPDYKLTLHNLLPKGDMVMVSYSISGTQESDFMGIKATHSRLTISGIDVFKLEKGEVVAHWDAAHQFVAL